MTREEAIARIKNHKIVHKMNEPRAIYISEALEMAIKALEQEPCEEAISRQAVHELVRSLTRWCVRSEDGKFNNVGLLYDDVMFGIDRLPSVKPQEPRWDRLYSWLNDMRLGIVPDETVTDIDERNARIAQTDIIDEIMEWMLKQEPQERSDKK